MTRTKVFPSVLRRFNSLRRILPSADEFVERETGMSLATFRKLIAADAIHWRIHWDYQEFEPDGRLCKHTAWDGNKLTTVGAGDFWTGMATGTLAVPYSTTNAQLIIGDATTAATAADTDMGAAAGTKLNASAPTAVTQTGATAIIVTATYSPTPTVGEVVVCAAFAGASAANINDTWELSAASASAVTLLGSYVSSSTITFASATVSPINKYRQACSSVTPSTNQCVFVCTYGANNGNFHAQEWGLSTGGAASGVPVANATNYQHAPPPHLFDHVIADNGTKAQGNTGVLTATMSLA